jgi:hypothetical protein
MINLFSQKPARDPDAVLRIKQWAIDLLGLGSDVAVTVMELSCTEEGCPDVETVVGILEPGCQRKFKVFKPLAEVLRDDLEKVVRKSIKEQE